MNTTLITTLIVWIIIGALAGTVVGSLVRRGSGGFGVPLNLLLGMAGALIGGWLFDLFNINLGVLSQIAVAFDQIVAAMAGSLLLLLIVFLVQRWRARRTRNEARTTSSAAT